MRAYIVNPENPDTFLEEERPTPEATGKDLLVRVHAIALNPVDTKVRSGRGGKVLGWDTSGVVAAVGEEVQGFKVGDEVYYAGDITREGTNAEYHLVDERLVGHKPKSLAHLHAACVPLTGLTAWEGLQEQLRVKPGGRLLLLNAAGGVGSLVSQLAREVHDLTVIGTASRPETIAWSEAMGVHHVINHREPLPEQIEALGWSDVDYIFCCYGTEQYFETMGQLIAPQGHIVSIVETKEPLNMMPLFSKKASFSWEFMFAKSMHSTPDMASQGEILNQLAALIDEGTLRSTLVDDRGPLTAKGLEEAHRKLESGRAYGKIAFSLV